MFFRFSYFTKLVDILHEKCGTIYQNCNYNLNSKENDLTKWKERTENQRNTGRQGGLPGNTIWPFPDSQTLLLVFVAPLCFIDVYTRRGLWSIYGNTQFKL